MAEAGPTGDQGKDSEDISDEAMRPEANEKVLLPLFFTMATIRC